MYRERPSRVRGGIIWSSRSTGAGTRVLPDGCMDFLWDGHTLVVAGPDTHAHVFESDPGSWLVGLRFAPGFTPRLLGVPAGDLTNQRVPLAAIWSAGRVRQITDRLAACSNPATGLETVALEQGVPDDRDSALIDLVAGLARAGWNSTTIARRVGYSPRQLQRRSVDAFGYGTKTLSRILRMQRALDLVRRGERPADSAARAGYADQSHLSREIRDMAGVSLRELTG